MPAHNWIKNMQIAQEHRDAICLVAQWEVHVTICWCLENLSFFFFSSCLHRFSDLKSRAIHSRIHPSVWYSQDVQIWKRKESSYAGFFMSHLLKQSLFSDFDFCFGVNICRYHIVSYYYWSSLFCCCLQLYFCCAHLQNNINHIFLFYLSSYICIQYVSYTMCYK